MIRRISLNARRLNVCRRLGNLHPPNEAPETQRARLLFQCRKHGLKELEFIFNKFAMKHLNSMTKEQLDEFDAIINHPANEWLIFFWVMGTIDLPLELSDNETLKLMQSEMQNPQRINMAKKLYDQYDQLGNEFHYQSAVKTNIK